MPLAARSPICFKSAGGALYPVRHSLTSMIPSTGMPAVPEASLSIVVERPHSRLLTGSDVKQLTFPGQRIVESLNQAPDPEVQAQ